MTVLKKLLMGILLVVVVLFGIWTYQDNSALVSFRLAGFSLGELPLVVWVLAAFLIGITIGALVTLPSSMASRHKEQKYRQRLLASERKLAKLEAQNR